MTTLVEDGLPVGIRRAELPLPFPVGPVNCWVLLGDPLTVVDPGMLFEDSLDLLRRTMADAGLTLRSIEQIVVTRIPITSERPENSPVGPTPRSCAENPNAAG